MTSKIKVDNINKVSDDSNIINKCGTTITLGASGDSINLAAGASQTGFGRTGTVDWNTTPVTATPTTTTSGTGYFVNTTSGAITMNLPASPSAGDIVSIKDYTGTFATYACTVARNGSLIRSGTNDFLMEQANAGATFIYVDGVEGWQIFVDGSDADAKGTYITATGGDSVTTCGNCKIHKFTNCGTFCVSEVSATPANNFISYLVVAGGAAGGQGQYGEGGGGGGAGGAREAKSAVTCYAASPLATGSSTTIELTAGSIPVTVGGGGAGAQAGPGNNGNPSTFSTITSTAGGGAGGHTAGPQARPGAAGGSGGGSAGVGSSAGAGNTPPTTPAQGFAGGDGGGSPVQYTGGGGGGALAVGGAGLGGGAGGGIGGVGATSEISGASVGYAGGGGGGWGTCGTTGGSATQGGGAGQDGGPGSSAGSNGTANTGGGGGSGGNNTGAGGSGGKGIVIIRYKYQ